MVRSGRAIRYEYDGFAPVAMAGGTVEHATLQGNLMTALLSRLRGKPCRAFGSELKISVLFTRKADDRVAESVSGADAVLAMPEVGIEVLLMELYRDVAIGEDANAMAVT